MAKRSENFPDDDKKPDPIPGYLLTAIYTGFTMWIFSYYISDRKMLIMLSPVVYLMWYVLLFFTEYNE
ncbi:MAG: hypothetical protein IJI75_06245 [Solobacterium sp.]|nr:hypothetical protein [Solobacterium sp.]